MNNHQDLSRIEYFSTQYTNSEIKKEAIRGSVISIITKGLALSLQFISVIVLARLLSPDDFGLYAMASVFISIFFAFQDVGLSDATIQSPYLNHEILSSLFWINTGIGTLIACILVMLAPVAALFFKKKELIPMLMISAIGFIFWGLSFQHSALMKRKFLFLQINIINLVSYFVSISVAIISAAAGGKYWALVLRDLALALTNFLMTWMICKWRPGRFSKSPEVSKLVKFGLNSVGFYIVNYFSNYMDKTIIGKKFGSEPVGYYSRAYYIAVTPSSTINQSLFHVAISTLSKLRDDKSKFQKYYYNALSVLSLFGMPFAALIVIFNKEIVYILLGPKWAIAAKYFAILGLSAGVNIIYQTSSWLHVSLGRSDRWFKWGIFSSILLIAGFFIGLFYGIEGIAWAYTISIILFTMPAILYAGKPAMISSRLVIGAIAKNIIGSIISALIIWQIKLNMFNSLNIIIRLLVSLLFYICIHLSILIILNRGINPIFEPIKQIKVAIFTSASAKEK